MAFVVEFDKSEDGEIVGGRWYHTRNIFSDTTDSEDEGFDSLTGDTGDAYERVITRATVRKLLAQLPEDDRVILHEVFWEGKNCKEIAEERGVNLWAIRKLRRQALKKLRSLALQWGLL